MLNGIDVSNWQGDHFPWPAYHGKIQFAGIRVSEGLSSADPDAATNIAGARAIGAAVMGYHFLHASQDGARQAEAFLSHAKAAGLRPGDLVAVDIEDGGLDGLSVASMQAQAIGFTAELSAHFPGYNPVLYTEISMASRLTVMGECPLWLANPSRVHTGPIGPWTGGPSFEQVGQVGVDTDVFYGDAAALAKLAIPH